MYICFLGHTKVKKFDTGIHCCLFTPGIPHKWHCIYFMIGYWSLVIPLLTRLYYVSRSDDSSMYLMLMLTGGGILICIGLFIIAKHLSRLYKHELFANGQLCYRVRVCATIYDNVLVPERVCVHVCAHFCMCARACVWVCVCYHQTFCNSKYRVTFSPKH